MIRLILNPPFSYVQAAVPDEAVMTLHAESHMYEDQTDRDYILAGAVIFNLFKTASAENREDILQGLVGAMELSARLEGWPEERINHMHSVMWRSSHAFLVSNVDVVDRGKEIEELRKALKLENRS